MKKETKKYKYGNMEFLITEEEVGYEYLPRYFNGRRCIWVGGKLNGKSVYDRTGQEVKTITYQQIK